MSEEKSINLEPIEEKDLNTETKFKEGVLDGGVEKLFEGAEKAPEKIAEGESDYQKILSEVKQASGAGNDPEVKSDAAKVSEFQDADSQIQHLVQLALDKGIAHAVKVARHLDYYSLDKLHDILLTDELHKALVERKLLPEV